MANPFKDSYTKMWPGPGIGPSLSLDGYNIEADEDGVEIPQRFVQTCKNHGWTTDRPVSDKQKK